jgi:hypothetical protein
MQTYPYDSSRESLFYPGRATNFFQIGHIDNHAALCAGMARLAYVYDESQLEKFLKIANFSKVAAINYKVNGIQAFIATSSSDKLTIVSFRGTETDDPSDLFTDAKFTRERAPCI